MAVDFTVSVVSPDDIPPPHASRARYRAIVEDVYYDGHTREVHCSSRKDAKAVYAGIIRAADKIREKHDPPWDLAIYSRTLEDGTVSVFVERG